MAHEEFELRGVRQIIPSSGLWLRREPVIEELGAEFVPVIALALVDVGSPSPAHFLEQGFWPVTADDAMYGLIGRRPFEGLRLRYSVFHDVDFEERGVRLKAGAVPRSTHFIPDPGWPVPKADNDAEGRPA